LDKVINREASASLQQKKERKIMNRSISTIAKEISATWPKVNYAAKPYLEAMYSLDKISDDYYYDTGKEIVLRFLSNAGGWRGDDAKRIKAELKAMI
tara:strand:+ start:243 stop:533 length:291 start_codon:yes stop_codon:yes gene_type:complete